MSLQPLVSWCLGVAVGLGVGAGIQLVAFKRSDNTMVDALVGWPWLWLGYAFLALLATEHINRLLSRLRKPGSEDGFGG